jgi:3-oxoacyl-[acyl-carrier-protein] synthase-3
MFNMQMPDGMVIHQSVIDSCAIVTEKLLEQAGLTLDDIDVFITSDQTTLTWEAQLQRINVPKEKSTSLFYKYGNTVAALSPSNLHEMIETGRLQRGMAVLFMAHGAGASGGGLIFKRLFFIADDRAGGDPHKMKVTERGGPLGPPLCAL